LADDVWLIVYGHNQIHNFYFLGLQITTAINASVLSGATPIAIVIVSFIILRIKLTPAVIAGTVLGIISS
jgi:drug/metabolite transporter (DMT)-like permease